MVLRGRKVMKISSCTSHLICKLTSACRKQHRSIYYIIKHARYLDPWLLNVTSKPNQAELAGSDNEKEINLSQEGTIQRVSFPSLFHQCPDRIIELTGWSGIPWARRPLSGEDLLSLSVEMIGNYEQVRIFTYIKIPRPANDQTFTFEVTG